ncbi:AMP-binding protein (plasmid) [Streptomyces sp. NBC_01591]|uniref:class I adenylate-forming enzyme family protein n=1 Tax=Streptomyces sp. NBC_01591 TaxID=2975888 RepID=UPI002DD95803|nr:AMP-binding protein [Streptomyces sp. NBC_01591]WSD74094.1 AMP-binding protein [Streptomyces sp. NBC_01591]
MTPQDQWWRESDSYVSDILSAFAAAPDRPALFWRGRVFSGSELIRSTAEIFCALRDRGVGREDVVAILVAPNSPEMLTARYAAHLLGGTICYLRSTNPGTSSTILPLDHQIQILRDTAAATVYADAENTQRALELSEAAGGLRVTRIGGTGYDAAGRADTPRAAPWDPGAVAVIGFTSGSTGRPKGIRLSARVWNGAVRGMAAADRAAEDVKLLVTTPLSHTVGTMADAALALGGEVHLHEHFDAGEFTKTVEESAISWTFMATVQLFRLLDHLEELGAHDLESAGLSSLNRLIYSGSAAAPARIAQAVRILGLIMVQAYGTSETGRITSLKREEHLDPWLSTTVGRPFPEVEVVVGELVSGAPVPTGEAGQVRVRSPHLMDGYTGDPELTAKVLREGWYYTGDIGYCDEKGYLHLLGRVAEVIKVNGVKVHPTVVEREILSLPGIRHAAVYSVPDRNGSEHIHAALVCDPAAEVETESIRAHIAESLSVLHAPERITILSALPLNENGKPDKLRLRLLDI